jgi:YHS domain-containing protein
MTETEAEYGGKCAMGVGIMGLDKAPAGKANHALVKDGKTYYFTSGVSKALYQYVPGIAGRAAKKAAT